MPLITLNGFSALLDATLTSTGLALPLSPEDLVTLKNALGTNTSQLVITDGTGDSEIVGVSCVDNEIVLIRGDEPLTFPVGSCIKFELTEEFIEEADEEIEYKGLSPIVVEDDPDDPKCKIIKIDTPPAVSFSIGNCVYTYEDGVLTEELVEDGLEAGTYANATLVLNEKGQITKIVKGTNVVNPVVQKCGCEKSGGLGADAVKNIVEECLKDYYTRTEVNDLIEGLQNALNLQNQQLVELSIKQAECCEEEPIVFPEGDFDNILSNVCPASVSTTITNPDGFSFSVTSTGNGVVTATVDGVLISDLSNFDVPDGAIVEFTVNGDAGSNEVGTIVLAYDNEGENAGVLDTLQYDIDCPAGNSPPTSDGTAPLDQEIGEGESIADADFSNCFNDLDGDPLTYALTPTIDGLVVDNTSGVVSGTPDLGSGTYAVTVEATDPSGASATCSFELVINQASFSGEKILTGTCTNGDSDNPNTADHCGVTTTSTPAGLPPTTGSDLGPIGNGTLHAFYVDAAGTATLETDATDLISITIENNNGPGNVTLSIADATQIGNSYVWANSGVARSMINDNFTIVCVGN